MFEKITLHAATVAVAAALAGSAMAQTNYPTRPITMIVPYAAGGGVDVSARLSASLLEKRIGQAIIVENVGGASGAIGAQKAAGATPDGYTILYGSQNELIIAPLASPSARYRLANFTPVAMISTTSAVLFGRKGLGASNVDELIALSKTKKDGLSFAHPGPGTFQYLTALAIMKQAGIEPRYVAYRAAPQMAQDVLSGHVDITILSLPAAAGFLENGSAISLGVLRGERDAMVPNLPTINESQSFKNIDAPLWLGLFAPKGVPDAALKRLTQAVKEMNADPDLPAQRRKTGEQIAKIDTAEAFAAFTEEEDRKLTQLVKIANSAQGGDEKK